MSTSLIIQDSRLRPELFHWRGPIVPAELRRWLEQHHLEASPKDLVLFWEQTGGGDFLESETMLGPFGDAEMGDALIPVNIDCHLGGLPDTLVVFHTGSTTSAIDMTLGDYVELHRGDLRPLRRFRSLDEWYDAAIRSELGARYGLPPIRG